MTTDSYDMAQTTAPRLFVAWQHPETRAIEPVAVLSHAPHADVYSFSYLQRVKTLDGFEPFSAFPDVHQTYRSGDLFPFFANRVMARRRSDFAATMKLFDLGPEAEPFEVLARSGGRRETDHLEVFPVPCPDRDGRASCMFFIRGLRYVEGSEDTAAALEVGEELHLLTDTQNPQNSRAQLVVKTEGMRPLGYLPDYLVEHAVAVFDGCGPRDVHVTVEHVNPRDTSRHMRVLCKITSGWPKHYAPFSEPEYQPISPS